MKTVNDIVKSFEKDLEEAGVDGFVYAISDPDSHHIVWGRGLNALWQHGALDFLSRINQLKPTRDDDEE